MRKKIARFFKLSICIVFGITLLFASASCLLRRETPPIEYEVREVGDFIVWFYEDYCEIYGTTEQGNSKKFLVIPEYIDGVRVDAFGFRSILGAIDITSQDELTCPRIESDTIEKIYFKKGISCYPNLSNGYISSTVKKIMYPTVDGYGKIIDGRDIYYPCKVYEKAKEEGKIGVYAEKYPANVSYYYNCENEENKVYYFIDDYDYGEKIEFIPPEPKREGYTFDGWYKEPECINKWDFETDTLPEEKTEQKLDPNSQYGVKEVTVYQETILYAKWIQEQTDKENKQKIKEFLK